MGVSLDYRSAGSLDTQVRGTIVRESEQLRETHDWWCEKIWFFDNHLLFEEENMLEGSTKLFYPGGYSDVPGSVVDVDGDEDDFMARRDAAFIIEQLLIWSKRFSITWLIEMADVEFGSISNGKLSRELVSQFQKQVGWNIQAPVDEALAEKISRKYASRK